MQIAQKSSDPNKKMSITVHFEALNWTIWTPLQQNYKNPRHWTTFVAVLCLSPLLDLPHSIHTHCFQFPKFDPNPSIWLTFGCLSLVSISFLTVKTLWRAHFASRVKWSFYILMHHYWGPSVGTREWWACPIDVTFSLGVLHFFKVIKKIFKVFKSMLPWA